MNDKLRQLLCLGLSQAAVDCWMPRCVLHPSRDLDEFFSQVDELYPPGDVLRIVAHPLKAEQLDGICNGNKELARQDSSSEAAAASVPFHRMPLPASWALEKQRGGPPSLSGKRIVLAVGPDGGWSDGEVQELTRRGFIRVHMLGERVLRTDIAVSEWVILSRR